MFDISANIDEPEQTFYLCGSPTSFKSRMFSCDNGDMEAVSFDFGDTNAANWSCLTVFGLLKSGGVVSICPVLPDDSLLPENTVECLESATNAAMQMGNDNERVPLYWQMKYVQALKALANRDEANRYTRPQFKLGPARQGPYLLNLSSTLSEGGMDDYTDIKIVSCTLGLVALIASPRGLQISVLLDAIEPDWNVSDMVLST